MMFDFNWNILEAYVPFFISGTKLTIELSVTASLAGFFLGLFLAVLRVSGRKFLSLPAACFMECIRGTPLLLQLLVVYFGIIPLLMRKPDGTLAAMLALSINAGAYIAETIRGGILAVDEGQEEAARALGLSHWQCLRYVVLPQAVRSVLPALGNSLSVSSRTLHWLPSLPRPSSCTGPMQPMRNTTASGRPSSRQA